MYTFKMILSSLSAAYFTDFLEENCFSTYCRETILSTSLCYETSLTMLLATLNKKKKSVSISMGCV